jgi:hypothetical protein
MIADFGWGASGTEATAVGAVSVMDSDGGATTSVGSWRDEPRIGDPQCSQ